MCNKSFSHSYHLQTHKHRVHSNRRPYHCPYCGKMFKTNSDLKSHVDIHTCVKPYSRSHCSDGFTRPDQLKHHLLTSHNAGTWLVYNISE